MKTIYKYHIALKKEQTIVLPMEYQILGIQMQNDTLCMWVMVDMDNPVESINIRIYGTGHEITEEDIKHIGTIQIDGFVWHVFTEVKK